MFFEIFQVMITIYEYVFNSFKIGLFIYLPFFIIYQLIQGTVLCTTSAHTDKENYHPINHVKGPSLDILLCIKQKL